MARSKTLSGQLREYVRAGMRRYGNLTAFSKACQIAEPVLHRFMAGQDLRLTTADRLASFFGCELTEPLWGGGKD